MDKNINENSFDGASIGSAGALNYQTPVGTHSSPSNYQDPSKFSSSDYNKYFNKDITGQPDTQKSDNSGSFSKDVEQLFKQKEKPTIDDIMAGMQYELQRMIKKDKRVAKERVIDNMKKHGAKYYTQLDMLNIDDKEMEPEIQERINIINQMISEKQEKRKDFKLNDEIQNILREKQEQKFCKTDYLLKKSISS
jgi:hypothetical protein